MNTKPILACNWKMNLTHGEMERLVIAAEAAHNGNEDKLEVIVCPAYTALQKTQGLLKLHKIQLGAQDMFWEDSGSYTGEISPLMLREVGCEFVILGHSERRAVCNETDDKINRKVIKAIEHNLVPIVCVGETFEQKQEGKKDIVIMEQVKKALTGVKEFRRLIIAYEPVWVIGTGEAVEPKDASDSLKVILYALRDLYPEAVVKEKMRFLYGGSVDPSNINGFLSEPEIDGALVGGASIDEEKLTGMIQALTQ